MKQRLVKQRSLLRVTQGATAVAAFALLAACGGGEGNSANAGNMPAGGVNLQVVAFGDSLSDAGTYAAAITPTFGGGRFTTNPGEVWTQKVAEYYGGTLTPAYEGGFGQALVATGGFDYAQGGAEVTNPAGESTGATSWPISLQVSNYLGTYGSFNSNQLVLVNGGANDIFQNSGTLALAIQAQLAATPPANATEAQRIVLGVVKKSEIGQAAEALAGLVQQIVNAGATHVVVSTLPDIGQTPLGRTQNQQASGAAALLSAISGAYNGILTTSLAPLVSSGKVVIADTYTWLDTQILPKYQSLGFTVSNTGTGCNLVAMQQNATRYATQNPSVLSGGMTAAAFGQQFASSLFCSPQTYTTANADQTYVFADVVHPSTHTHALFAQYVEQRVAASGLGK
ncbi:SGNH/GDSL hydrolase family protein [Paraburkholderia sediminicola]|uniref:SGNH/GDSL hydrolase family protein n=1 Tax=Paraburkholderia sediminicola TaxID=458836 RepID=UPI0038B6D2F6